MCRTKHDHNVCFAQNFYGCRGDTKAQRKIVFFRRRQTLNVVIPVKTGIQVKC